MIFNPNGRKKQKGSVLAVSLIFLLVLTILALAGTKTTLLEEKMASNIKNKNLAFQAAETTLRSAENWLNSEVVVPEEDGVKVYGFNGESATDPSWWWPNNIDDDSENNGTSVEIELVNKNPRFIIEEQDFIRDSLNVGHGVSSGQYIHRVTAFGVGGRGNTYSVLQSSFLKRYNE